MRYKLFFIFALFSFFTSMQAQEYQWNVELNYFFNNNENRASTLAPDKTMTGTWLNTLGGISWDNSHTLFGGVNLLQIPGTQPAINKVDVTLFYRFETERMYFRAGAFPRSDVLANYNTFFFRDSVNHFRPQMQGIFWQFGNRRNFFNAWLDWTAYQTPENPQREGFFFGFSGRASKNMFFADFQSYVFHLSGRDPNVPERVGVSEQMQILASIGAEYQSDNNFSGLLSAGVLAGVERLRQDDLRHRPVGFVVRANTEFWGIGTQNTLYVGNPRMKFYEREGNLLYWQTPFLRGSSYVKSSWYIRLLETRFARVKFSYVLHFSEGRVMEQQVLTVVANVGSTKGRRQESANRAFPWDRIFR